MLSNLPIEIPERPFYDPQFRVTGGATSVSLDTDTLETVGLTLTAADGTAEPASEEFDVAFAINRRNTTFLVNRDFSEISGEIAHTGSVTFNDEIRVGDFIIAFDAERQVGDASGFFVKDTITFDTPLFDLSNPGVIDLSRGESFRNQLTIAETDLLVSPELAEVLEDASLTGADVGDAQVNANVLNGIVTGDVEPPEIPEPPFFNPTFKVTGGATSVSLDTDTLETAGLELTAADGTAEPASDEFGVAFAINRRDTTFTFNRDLSGISGEIAHTGSVTFNEDTEVGDFIIGFDEERQGEGTSGFFVKDTITFDAVLFDISTSAMLDFGRSESSFRNQLTITDADLLVSPEFAEVLGNTDLTGTDVGDAQVNANVLNTMFLEMPSDMIV